jgi:hypothetical protein
MRFRPRFSVRTLAIVVTLVCAYLGAWEVTNRVAEQQGKSRSKQDVLIPNHCPFDLLFKLCPDGSYVEIHQSESPAPFIIYRDEQDWDDRKDPTVRRKYYLWLFGPKIKIPIEYPSPEYL